MPKVSTTVMIDEAVLRVVSASAARAGVSESELIELSLRRELGLELIERLWANADLDEGRP
jgi:hypothetical protein